MENNNIEVETKSTVLNEEEVNNIVNKEENAGNNEEIVLPSEENNVELPEKYAGKSAEEVYRLMKVEEEYQKSNQKGGDVPNEEVSVENNNENIETTLGESEVKEIIQDVIKNGGEFTEEIYKKLEEGGISKDIADNYKLGVEAKAQKQVEETLKDVGTNLDEYSQAGKVIRDIWDEKRISDFNEAMDAAEESGNTIVQKALIRSLLDAAKGAPKADVKQYHSNTQIRSNQEGYSTKSDYFKDVNDRRYGKDKSFTKLVEQKFIKTDRKNW